MYVSETVKYIGVNDKRIDLFEGQYRVPSGMSYNSYAIFDEKIAVMDTVDAAFTDEWLGNLSAALGDRLPDYLVVQHMEPDHSANVVSFANAYPNAIIVSSQKAFAMMKSFFGTDFSDRRIVVGDSDTLSLGSRSLTFITAPMVHWPEVIMTYDSADKLLFSADGFGKFGALDADEPWCDEARRYYFGIVGKYGTQVQSVLKKAATLDIRAICPLHGPVLSGDVSYYLGVYNVWSSYSCEQRGVVIAYTSVYGNTRRAVELLRSAIEAKGVSVTVYDLARCDMSAAVADAFRYSALVLATTTYNADVFPHMRSFIEHLTERGYRSRVVATIENGTWAPMAAKVMRAMLEGSRELTYADTAVRITSALDSGSERSLYALADELAALV